jgi:putative restriction endonuclease
MLIASHIKPWRISTSTERLDVRNGLAACPTHDIAFDTPDYSPSTVACVST